MELKKIIKFHKKYEPDILICNRSILNRWSEYFISYISNFFFKIKDPLSGLKIYKTFKLKQVINKIKDNNYLVDIVYFFNKRNFKTMNFLTKVNKRNGKSKLGQEYLVNLKILSLLRLFF